MTTIAFHIGFWNQWGYGEMSVYNKELFLEDHTKKPILEDFTVKKINWLLGRLWGLKIVKGFRRNS